MMVAMTKYILFKIKYLWAVSILLLGVSATSCSEEMHKKTAVTAQWQQKEVLQTLSRAFGLDFFRLSFLNLKKEIEPKLENKEIWQALSRSFRLNEEVEHPQVEKHIKKLLQNKPQLQKLIEYSSPYLYYIHNEVKKRNLPGELALIPIVESAFDPFAKSHAGAVGLWQLMPATSSDLGVTRDWWFDGRRDIHESTQASLQYFEYLNKFFKGDWSLAIAAYNAGQGRVKKAMNKNENKGKSTSYWSLPLPKETKDYVPKLFALAKIIENPERYNVNLPFIPNTPYFKFIKLDSPIELAKAAKLANMNLAEFKDLNPGHKQWLTQPETEHKIAVPVEKIPAFKKNLEKATAKEADLVEWKEHTVKKGESMQKIAKNYKMPKQMLTEVNDKLPAKVKPGSTVWIPRPAVQLSDKLSDKLAANIDSKDYVKLGSIGNGKKSKTTSKASAASAKKNNTTAKTKPTEAKNTARYHKVKSGESLGAIARKYHVSVKKLKRSNQIRMTKKGLVRAGQRLVIPV